MAKNKGVIILILVVVAAILILPKLGLFSTSTVLYRETPELGVVKITLTNPGIFSNLFTAYFSKTQVYSGEPVTLTDTYPILNGECSVYSWKLYISNADGSWGSPMELANTAQTTGVNYCNLQVTYGFSTDTPGTYKAKSESKYTSTSSVNTINGGNTVTVLATTSTTPCAYQGMARIQDINGGTLYENEYKDLNPGDSNLCTDKHNLYQTKCDSGYHIQGMAVGNQISDSIKNCVSDTTGTSDDCASTVPGTFGFCTSVGSKSCLSPSSTTVGAYTCTDYGTKGKCWAIADTCTNGCTNGDCNGGTTTTQCTATGQTCRQKGFIADANDKACVDNGETYTGLRCNPGATIGNNGVCCQSNGQGYNGTANSNARQVAVSSADVGTLTTTELILKSACTQTEQCENGSQCQSLQSLVDSKSISDISAKQIANTMGDTAKTALSYGTGAAIAVKCSIVAIPTTGGWGIPVCAAAGIAAGIGLDKIFDIWQEKSLVKTGICIKSGGGFCIPQINSFMAPITKLDCSTNTIIFFAIIVVLLLLLMR